MQNEQTRIKIGNQIIEQKKINKSTKTLRVHMNPSIDWTEEFKHAKGKLELSIKKLMNAEMAHYQVFVYFNAHVLTNVYFGCGIVKFSLVQLDMLKKTHE